MREISFQMAIQTKLYLGLSQFCHMFLIIHSPRLSIVTSNVEPSVNHPFYHLCFNQSIWLVVIDIYLFSIVIANKVVHLSETLNHLDHDDSLTKALICKRRHKGK